MRLTFTKEEPLRYIGHLDLVRMWERAFRRARLPLAYTLGFTPHPRLTFAAPLALGATSEAELMDVYLREPLSPEEVVGGVAAQLPAGCRVVGAALLTPEGPALTGLTRWAAYAVLASALPARDGRAESAEAVLGSRWQRGRRSGDTEAAISGDEQATAADEVPWRPPSERLPPPEPDPPLPEREEVAVRISRFLAAQSVPLTRARDGKAVDARPNVLALEVGDSPVTDRLLLEMVLRLDSSGAGRPDDVAAALGLRARAVHRRKIGLEGEPPG